MNKIANSIALIMSLLSYSLQAGEKAGFEKAILAGGCFWCIEADFEKLEGVVDVVSGYTGGRLVNPTYRQVAGGNSGHAEAVQVTYDPARLSYAEILQHFWRHIDPTRDDGQFCDTGEQYRPAIFYKDFEQKMAAHNSQARIESTKPFPDEIKVELIPATKFYPAEEYHQDYSQKHPVSYWLYRFFCGRDSKVARLWGDF